MSALRSRAISTAQKLAESIYSTLAPKQLLDVLQEMSVAQSTGVSIADHLALYRHVLQRRPKYVLELGAGQSSASIALARESAGRGGRFVAVEESPEWLAHHREVIPSRLASMIDLIQRDVKAKDVFGRRVAHYIDLPRLPYEMVHVDGPYNRAVGAEISCDVLDLLPDLNAKCLIVLDGRENTARFLKKHLETAGFKVKRHPFTFSYEFVRG